MWPGSSRKQQLGMAGCCTAASKGDGSPKLRPNLLQSDSSAHRRLCHSSILWHQGAHRNPLQSPCGVVPWLHCLDILSRQIMTL